MIFDEMQSAIATIEGSTSSATREEPRTALEATKAVLNCAFPALTRILGADVLIGLVGDFARANSAHSAQTSRLGLTFPRYIDALQLPRHAAYLGDVARLELLVLHADSLEHSTLDALQSPACLSNPRYLDHVVNIHPSAELFMSRTGAVSIWRQCISGLSIGSPNFFLIGDAALIIRVAKEVDVISLEFPGCEVFLALLMRGHTIREAADGTRFVEPRFDCSRSIEFLVSTGAIVTVEPGPSRCTPPTITALRQRSRICVH